MQQQQNRFFENVTHVNPLKAMDPCEPDHITALIAIIVCKFIQKLITKIDFWYQADLLSPFVHISLIPIV